MLRDLKIGAILYVLDKKERTIGEAEVLQAVLSMTQFQYNPSMPFRQTMAVRARYNGKEVVFNNLFADQSSCEDNGNGIVVCENKDALLAELKSFKMTNDNLVSRMEEFVENSKWCDEQLVQLDPVKKAEAESAKQFDDFKKDLADIKSLLSKVLNAEKEK